MLYSRAGYIRITIWHMRLACLIPKHTIRHTEYAIFITFPLQQWLHKRASVLRYTYISCLLKFCITGHFVVIAVYINGLLKVNYIF